MPDHPPTLFVQLWVPEPDPRLAFDQLTKETRALPGRSGVRFELGPHGHVWAVDADGGEREIAAVQSWEPGHRIALVGKPLEWDPEGAPPAAELRFEPSDGGTMISLAYRNLADRSSMKDPSELVGWFAGEILGPLVRTVSPGELGEWITDRVARSPSGERARSNYAEPMFHRPNFLLILERLALSKDDSLLEVGCGGGAFLRDALKSGCRAWAIDHSPDMVATARELNREAVAAGRADIREAEAEQLPFPDAICSCAVSTGVWGFIEDPLRALTEMHRVLRPGGRLIVFSGSKVLRGTPAAPEPIASRLHWYEDEELVDLARQAGFIEARVDRPDFVPYARAAGLPEDVVAFFASLPGGGQVLQARRAPS